MQMMEGSGWRRLRPGLWVGERRGMSAGKDGWIRCQCLVCISGGNGGNRLMGVDNNGSVRLIQYIRGRFICTVDGYGRILGLGRAKVRMQAYLFYPVDLASYSADID